MAPNLSTLRPLVAGDVIFELKPLIHIVFKEVKDLICNQCFERSQSIRKCSKCLQMYYCGEICQSIDWEYHKNECQLFQHKNFKPEEYSDEEFLLLRLWLTIKSDSNFATERYQLPNGSDISLKDIQISKKFSEDSNDLLEFNQICKHFKRIGIQFKRKELMDWLTTMRRTPIIASIHTLQPTEQLFGCQMFRPFLVGIGVFPQLSAVRHSCVPNSGVNTNGLSLQLRAMDAIDFGSEITISYVNLAQNKTDRHNELKTRFLINDCNCLKCDRNLDSDIDYQKFEIIVDTLELQLKELMSETSSESVLNWSQMQAMSEELSEESKKIFGSFHPNRVLLFGKWLIVSSLVKKRNGYTPCVDIELYEEVKKQYRVVFGENHPFITHFDLMAKDLKLIE